MQSISTKTTKIVDDILNQVVKNKRIIINQGGMGSSKTYSILQVIIMLCRKTDKSLLISIVSETFPHLKRGAMKDFIDILESWNMFSERNFNRSDYTYKIDKCKVEFFSADQPDKMKGARRDILFINEANNVNYHVWEQLEPRTKWMVFVDFNPDREFWIHTEVMQRDNAEMLHSTYLDNEFLSSGERNSIESRKHNERWWKVYGLGVIGTVDGLILTNWSQINDDEFPEGEAFYGIDFGFTNNPTAVVKIVRQAGVLYVHEVLYTTGLISRRLIDKLQACELSGLTVADVAQPITIADINDAGIKVLPSMSYKGSVNKRIEMLEDYEIRVTKSSVNVIKELRNWQWIYDKKENKYINTPVDQFNHALKALGYAVEVKTKYRRGIKVHN